VIGNWKLSANFLERGDVLLSVTEMPSLYLSRQLLAPLLGTQFGDGFSSALDKIKTMLPSKALAYFRSLDERRFVKSMPGHDYSAQDKEIRVINQAIAESRVLRRLLDNDPIRARCLEFLCEPRVVSLFRSARDSGGREPGRPSEVVPPGCSLMRLARPVQAGSHQEGRG